MLVSPIYGDLGDGLLLLDPHYIAVLSNQIYLRLESYQESRFAMRIGGEASDGNHMGAPHANCATETGRAEGLDIQIRWCLKLIIRNYANVYL